MSSSIPIRTSDSPSYSRQDLISAIHSFYAVLTALPYVAAESLVHPPVEGWPQIDVSGLQARGKTQEVIDLLRHLPYLRVPVDGKRWMVAPDAVEIDYSSGEIYSGVLDAIQPTPAWCVWLIDPESRDGTGLLLDTTMGWSDKRAFFDEYSGTITEFSTLGHKIMIDWEEYENLPLENKWMAHPTLPVVEFFKLWKRKFERLVWMPVARSQGPTAEWYITAATRDDEEDMLASDDSFDLDEDDDQFDEEDEKESKGEDEIEESGKIPDEEVDELMKDAYGQEAIQRQAEFQSHESISIGSNPAPAPPSPELKEDARLRDLEGKTKEVYQIYTRNGWPLNFDRKMCKDELAVFQERQVGKRSRRN